MADAEDTTNYAKMLTEMAHQFNLALNPHGLKTGFVIGFWLFGHEGEPGSLIVMSNADKQQQADCVRAMLAKMEPELRDDLSHVNGKSN